MALTDAERLLSAAAEVCASVSAATLAKRGNLLAHTLVNPYELRDLADAVEVLHPGLIEYVRSENAKARAALR